MRSLILAVGAVLFSGSTLLAQVQANYLYALSDFTGPIPYDWARIYVDEPRNETYVIYRDLVRIFNGSGMEIYSFGENLDVGQLADITADKDGNILLLSYVNARPLVTRCDFRGVPIGPVAITGLPDGLQFAPNRMIYEGGLLYFASLSTGTVIITDGEGRFRERIELIPMLDAPEKQKAGAELVGFSVDKDANIFFTIPVLFKVYKLSADRTLSEFGKPGSLAGQFGVLSGVVSDSRGNIIVADKLKCVINIFDKDFRFVREFGFRGAKPQNIIFPDALAIDSRDHLYVTQGRRRGISVFALVVQ